jgi:hypothetical protein
MIEVGLHIAAATHGRYGRFMRWLRLRGVREFGFK